MTDLETVRVVVFASERAAALETRLADLGCRVSSISETEPETEHALRSERPDALIFATADVGEGFLERARRSDPSCAFVAWLANASSGSVADLFERGADEVVHDGMGHRELAARISAAARRSRIRPSRPMELGGLHIDVLNGEAEWSGQDLGLTRREREVLHALADSPGRTVRREILYKRVWGYAMARGDRSVDVNIKRLRAKLTKLTGGALEIKTQPGIGYRLELEGQVQHAGDTVTAL